MFALSDQIFVGITAQWQRVQEWSNVQCQVVHPQQPVKTHLRNMCEEFPRLKNQLLNLPRHLWYFGRHFHKSSSRSHDRLANPQHPQSIENNEVLSQCIWSETKHCCTENYLESGSRSGQNETGTQPFATCPGSHLQGAQAD